MRLLRRGGVAGQARSQGSSAAAAGMSSQISYGFKIMFSITIHTSKMQFRKKYIFDTFEKCG